MTRELQQAQIVDLVMEHCPTDGMHNTPLEFVRFFRDSVLKPKLIPWMYEPMVVISVQGRKTIYLDGNRYGFHPGRLLVFLMP
ncbi:MAG: AraC family transcriptional regulator N-terminal domain-containing protein, partial [Cyanobacteria bacterium P01_F01_bin.153]